MNRWFECGESCQCLARTQDEAENRSNLSRLLLDQWYKQEDDKLKNIAGVSNKCGVKQGEGGVRKPAWSFLEEYKTFLSSKLIKSNSRRQTLEEAEVSGSVNVDGDEGPMRHTDSVRGRLRSYSKKPAVAISRQNGGCASGDVDRGDDDGNGDGDDDDDDGDNVDGAGGRDSDGDDDDRAGWAAETTQTLDVGDAGAGNFFRLSLRGHDQRVETYKKLPAPIKVTLSSRLGDDSPYSCPYCFLIFTYKHDAEKHLRHKHATATELRCPQAGCGAVVADRASYKRHMASAHHIAGQRVVKRCWECDKTFGTTSGLWYHLQRAHKSRREACAVCGVQVGKFSLQDHMRLHQERDAWRYECPYAFCRRPFATRQALQYHVRTRHEREKLQRVACDVCGKRFPSTSAAQRHQDSCTGTKQFQCEDCGLTLSRKNALVRHRRDKHSSAEDLRHKCDECEKRYTRLDSLRRHKDKHHFHL